MDEEESYYNGYENDVKNDIKNEFKSDITNDSRNDDHTLGSIEDVPQVCKSILFSLNLALIIIIIIYINRIYTAKSRPSTPKRQRCLIFYHIFFHVSPFHEVRHLNLP